MLWKNWSWPARIWSGLGVLFIVFTGFALSAINHKIEFNFVQSHCPSNLKQIGLALMQYAQDYDDKLPAVTINDGWANAAQPYIKSTRIFKCPWAADFYADQPNPKFTGYTDYFYNSQLQNLKVSKLNLPAQVVEVADGNDEKAKTDAGYALPGIPTAWRFDSSSPAFRHDGSANYLFADGHVKGLKAQDVSNNWDAKKAHFQPQKPK